MWSVTCYDWSDSTNAEAIEWHARRQIKRRSGNVILLHDGSHREMGADRHHSIEASRRIIRTYKGEGYEFATVPEVMEPEPLNIQSAAALS
jgi:peptidoglycan/xylan/chitin deacetylase (PgdA/CDA1 family)